MTIGGHCIFDNELGVTELLVVQQLWDKKKENGMPKQRPRPSRMPIEEDTMGVGATYYVDGAGRVTKQANLKSSFELVRKARCRGRGERRQ